MIKISGSIGVLISSTFLTAISISSLVTSIQLPTSMSGNIHAYQRLLQSNKELTSRFLMQQMAVWEPILAERETVRVILECGFNI